MSGSTSTVRVELALDRRINFAVQQNGAPVIRLLRLHNGPERLEDVRVRLTLDPPVGRPAEVAVAAIDPGGTCNLGAVNLTLEAERLANQSEREAGTLRVEVRAGDRLVGEHVEPVEILAYNEWSGVGSTPELLAAFVLPNHPALAPILKDAARRVGLRTGSDALDGYQRRDPQRVAHLVTALYDAVQAAGVTYANPPASFELGGQKIRTPEQILDGKLATCLDLTVLLAALLEAVGLHAWMIVVQGHAFPGVWLTRQRFPDPVLDDVVAVRKRVDLQEALVFDSSAVASGVPFEDAERRARECLEASERFQLLLDLESVRAARRVRPLPLRLATGAGYVAAAPEVPATPAESVVPTIRTVEAPAPARAPAAAPTEPKLERWKRRLLDLSLRNRLLNLRPTRGTVRLHVPDLAALEDRLASGDAFQVVGRASELPPEHLAASFASGRLHAPHTDEEVGTRMLELYRLGRSALEESGAQTLYLALGVLRWTETPSSEVERVAPLVLLPIRILRGPVREPFRIELAEDEPRANVTLLEKMKREFGVDVTGLDELPEDESGLDLPRILDRFRRAVVNLPRWEVREEVWIAQLTFTKFLMWLDLQARTEDLLASPVVAHVLRGSPDGIPLAAPFLAPEQLDEARPAREDLCVVDADSSQLAAIHGALDGNSFVLQGPPGTGKSQTITNLIAQTLARGRTVLFVSEKRAALEVVHDRLTRAGLGPFCLELHSSKASRREVVRQLEAPLQLAGHRSAEDWTRHADRLQAARVELNEIASLLHRPGPFGESPYQVAGRLLALADAPAVTLAPDPRPLDRARLDAIEEAADELGRLAHEVGPPTRHAWHGTGWSDWNPLAQDELGRALDDLRERARTLEAAFATAREALGWSDAAPTEATQRLLERLGRLLPASPAPTGPLLTEVPWAEVEARIAELRRLGEHRNALVAEVGARWTEAFRALPLDALEARFRRWTGAFFLLAFLFLWSTRRGLARVARGRVPANAVVLDDLGRARASIDDEALLERGADDGRRLLGRFWRGVDTDWARVGEVVQWAKELREAIADLPEPARAKVVGLAADPDALRPDRPTGKALAALVAARAAYADALGSVVERLRADPDLCFGPDGALDAVARRVDRWRAALRETKTWAAWLRARARLVELGLPEIVAAVEEDRVPAAALRRAVDRAVRERWLKALHASEPLLAQFRGVDHERRIARFRELDVRARELAKQEVVARLAARLPDPNAPGEMATIRRELKKKQRHLPPRRLFAEIPTTLLRLKPCVLMSPLSTAQYLDPKLAAFDLVVFDEASQIPPWDAIGAMARGRQVVVVGDSKQLPPTSFFDKADEDDDLDETQEEDLESILDECVGSGMQGHALRWHYRSRHEGLIAFSNHHYYEGRLLTFPSADAEVEALGVKWRHVPGFYDRGASRTNRAEAEAVVAEVVRCLQAPDATGSIGVVTFSMTQQRLVEDLLDAARARHPEIERFFGTGVPEPVFVKNLENVQGDERDVMLFSIGYGPDRAGKVTMNFGALNRAGGERRLNVAITRARSRLVVFSTLRPDQIDLSRVSATGVRHLRTFLDYAARGTKAIDEAVTLAPDAENESPFETAVEQALRRLGYDVHRQVGCSGYRIDLAIPDPDAPGRYVCGVECDGATYHSARCARDRDRLRQAVLEGLGWRLVRVWSTDWWHDPQREIRRLAEAIEAARRAPRGRPAPPPAPVTPPIAPAPLVGGPERATYAAAAPPAPARPTLPPDAVPYRIAPVGAPRPREELEARTADPLLASRLVEVVGIEGPIHVEEAARRVAAPWGVARVTEKLRTRILDALKALPAQGRPVRRGDFLWAAGQDPARWVGFRVPPAGGAPRAAEHLCAEEAANAAAWVLGRAVSIDRSELAREAARALGYARLGGGVQAAMERGIDHLVASGRAKIDGERVRVP